MASINLKTLVIALVWSTRQSVRHVQAEIVKDEKLF